MSDSTVSVVHNPARRRRWSREDPPNMRIILLGKDVSANSRVGNFILGRSAFDSEAPPDDHQIERVRGKDMMIINCPHLLQLNLSYHQIIQTVRECVNLSHPGPHLILIIFKHDECSREDQEHAEMILNYFSHSVYQHTLVLTTHNSHSALRTEVNDNIQKIIKKCFSRHYRLKRNCTSDELKETFKDMVKSNDGRYLICDVYEDAQSSSMKQQTDERGAEVKAGNLECLRVMLIGRTGSGKSATGNTILGRNEFKSKPSSDSVTTVCEKKVGEVDGQSVAVVDTPGLFDTKTQKEQVFDEIMKCVSLSAPGPHAFIIVLSLGRFTQEESDTIDLIKKIFGPKATQFSIVLFTGGDDLTRVGESIEDYVKEIDSAELKKLIRDCGDRYLVFNNREIQDRSQVSKLIKMIEEMKTTNHGRYFTNSMFEEAEMSIKKRMEEILREKEREYEEKKNEMMKHYEKLEQKRKDEWERKKQEDDERREEERKRWEKRIEDIKREKEEEIRRRETQEKERKEREEKEREKMKLKHELKIKEMEELNEYNEIIIAYNKETIACNKKTIACNKKTIEYNEKEIKYYKKINECNKKEIESNEKIIECNEKIIECNENLQQRQDERIKELENREKCVIQ